MKPLGKAVKIALDTNRPLQQAIDDLLSDYRSTPHPATGVAPGYMLFRGGYNSIFPPTPSTTEQVIEEAKKQDIKQKQAANERINKSKWRKYPNIIQGNEVLALRLAKRKKFQSLYEPTPYTVFDVKGAQYTLVPSDNSLSKQPIYRHASQIKLYCRQKPNRQSNSDVHSNSPFSNSTDQPKSIGFDFPDKRYTKQQLTNCANPAPIVEEPEHATHQATEQPSERPADAICHEKSEPDIIFCHPQQLLQDKPLTYGRAKKSNKNRK